MTKEKIKAILMRAVWTFFQTFLGVIGGEAVTLQDVKWGFVLSASTLAFILSIAKSIVIGIPELED